MALTREPSRFCLALGTVAVWTRAGSQPDHAFNRAPAARFWQTAATGDSGDYSWRLKARTAAPSSTAPRAPTSSTSFSNVIVCPKTVTPRPSALPRKIWRIASTPYVSGFTFEMISIHAGKKDQRKDQDLDEDLEALLGVHERGDQNPEAGQAQRQDGNHRNEEQDDFEVQCDSKKRGQN